MAIPRTPEPEVMDSVEEARDYDRMDHAAVNQVFVEDLLEFLRQENAAADPTCGAGVCDLGTGTARIPLELVRQWPDCPPIAACDLSMEMLRLARRHIRQAGLTGRVIPLLCDAKRLPFADRSVRIVISNSIVHHIPEPVAIFREMRRCLHSGGVLFLRDLLRPASDDHVEELVQLYAGSENQHQRQMFRDSLHAALTVDEVNQLLSSTGFSSASAHQTTDRHWTVAAVINT